MDQALIAELIKREAERMPEPTTATAQPDTPAKGSKGWKRAADLAFWGGAGADTASTAYSIYRDGIREANPMNTIFGEKGVLPLMVGYDALTHVLLDRVLGNHPKLRNIAKFGIGAVRGVQAAKNIQLVKGSR